MFFLFLLPNYICVDAIVIQFFYLDKREVLQREYSQPLILPSPHFRWVVSLVDPTRSLTDPTRSLVSPMQAYNAQREPQREQVKYRLRWVSSCWGSQWPCCFCQFHLLLVAKANAMSGGIWAKRDTTRSTDVIRIKQIQAKKAIEIQLVRPTKVCGKV